MSSRKKTKPRRVRCADQNEGLPGGRRPGSKHAAPAGDPADKVRTGQRSRTSARLIGTLVEIRTRRAVLLLTGLSLGMSCLLFPPVDGWWLAYVCLVPWLVCVCTAERARFVYFASLLMGLGFFGVHIRWLAPVTTPGYLALCVGFSVFFPLAAWPIRHMVRRHRVSVALTAPIAWVAMEYLRSITALGFPWALLGHSQYKILTVIQISDLVGAYGVSFVLVMVNGWITDLLIQPILIWRSDRAARLPVGSLTTLVVILGTMVYGSAGRSNRHFRPGPKVAIVQHDFPMYVDNRAGRASPNMIFNGYLELARKAAAEKPDLIIMPETAIACFINDEFLDATPDDLEDIRRRRYPMLPKGSLKNYQRFSRGVRDAFQKLCTESGVPIVLGFSSLEWKPKAIPPRVEAFNSAFLMEPGKTRPVTRYDKVHLVLFGEYVPFRYSHRSIYEWLNSLTPWGAAGAEYSLTAGSDYTVFEFDAASGDKQHYRAAVPICYEEIMPYIARRFVRGNGELDDMKHIDMLLTISNDGWFLHTAELEQHLASAVFRAIENRIAVARSVNTGASGQIHPNGKIHALVKLSPENIERLEPVAAALHRIEALLDRLKDRSQADAAYGQTFEELQRVFSQDLLEAVLAMGPEFSFMVERQSPLIVALTVKNPDDRRQAVRALRRQIEDDLNVVARWKKRPWTAPGYIVANLQLDDRVTLYSRWGDWFAQGTAALFVMMLLDWLLRRLLRGKNTARAGQREGTRKENVEPQPRRGAE